MFTLFDDEYITRAWQKEFTEESHEKGRQEGRQEGMKEGRQEGRQEGDIRSFVKSIRGFIAALGLDKEKAIEIAGVPEKYRAAVLAQL